MAEEMAGGVLEGTETIPSEVVLATPDAMAVDDVKADGVTEPEVLQPEVVDEKPVPGTVFLSSFDYACSYTSRPCSADADICNPNHIECVLNPESDACSPAK